LIPSPPPLQRSLVHPARPALGGPYLNPEARLRAGLFSFQESTMADYYTHFSCLLDPATGEQLGWVVTNAWLAHVLDGGDGDA